jgi:hypothetical protein
VRKASHDLLNRSSKPSYRFEVRSTQIQNEIAFLHLESEFAKKGIDLRPEGGLGGILDVNAHAYPTIVLGYDRSNCALVFPVPPKVGHGDRRTPASP